MNNKVIKSNQIFFPKNYTFVGDDKKTKIKFKYESIKNPPLHVMCRCTLLGVYNESELPSNTFSFREESEQRKEQLEQTKEFKEKQLIKIEKLKNKEEELTKKEKNLIEKEKKLNDEIKELDSLL